MRTKRIDELTKFIALDQQGFTYDPETGTVYNPKDKEVVATKNGYVYFFANIEIDGETHLVQTYVHRYGYWYVTGEIPIAIDHINRDRSDNRLSNIRSANYKLNANNRSMVRGFIVNHKVSGTSYIAHSFKGGKREILGHFSDPSEAFVVSYLKRKGELPTFAQVDEVLASL